jgi:hypothetical protein
MSQAQKNMRIRPIVWLNAALSLPAAVSLYGGLRNALAPGRSQDFQWSAAHLALHHIDPYRQYLIHDPQHLILMSQTPNYLQELYVLLLPLGAVNFLTARSIWAALNCLFAALIIVVLRRLYTLDLARTLLLALLLLASTPFRIVLGGGQQSLLELLFFCLVFYATGRIQRGLALGLSYSKYSFSPVLFLYMAFRRQYRVLAVSLLPPLLGLLALWFLVRGSLTTLATEPLAVSRVGVTEGLGDLMTLIHVVCDNILSASRISQLTYVAALLASTTYAFFLSRRRDLTPQMEIAPLAVASLMFFTHLTYDYVFLIVPLAACLAAPLHKPKVLVLSAIGLIWYGVKLIPLFGSTPGLRAAFAVIVFLLLAGMLVLLGRRDFASPAAAAK